jgi:hypothetical protein
MESVRAKVQYDFFQTELAEEAKWRAVISKLLNERLNGR